ncbi:Cysteine desulfurase =_ SufS, partial [hydrothermal vent metagenome]
ANRKGFVLKHVNITEDFDLDYKQAEELITPKTKIVSVSLAGNVLGTINDVRKIAELAHKVGAVMICDATKAAGHIPINARKLGCDFLIFSGHKMCGPTGIGVLYGKAELLDALPPSMFGGGIVEEVDLQEARWRSAPWKFEAGTPNIAGAIGLGEAVTYLENIGVEKIHEYVSGLTGYAIEELGKLGGVKMFTQKDADKNIGIVAFSVERIHSHDIAEIAGREGVAIRAGHHCAQPLMKELDISALARASFYLYNDKSDVNALVGAIKKAQEIFKV